MIPALPIVCETGQKRFAMLVNELGGFKVDPVIFSTNAHRHGAATLSRYLNRGAFVDDRLSAPDFLRKVIGHSVEDLPAVNHMAFLVNRVEVPRLVREIMIKRYNHPVSKIPGVGNWDALYLDLSLRSRSKNQFIFHISTAAA